MTSSFFPHAGAEGSTSEETAAAPAVASMDEIVSLCKRRGFIFLSSEARGYRGAVGGWVGGKLYRCWSAQLCGAFDGL